MLAFLLSSFSSAVKSFMFLNSTTYILYSYNAFFFQKEKFIRLTLFKIESRKKLFVRTQHISVISQP
jgi:hypothetical protein